MVTSRQSADNARGAFSFGPKQRIKKRADFLRIQNAGKKTRTAHFLLIAEPNNGPRSRLGITVTKKVDKRAFRRNYIKRRVREFFRLNRHRIGCNSDIVVIALQEASKLSGLDISKELDKLFWRSKALNFSRKSPAGPGSSNVK